MPAGKEIKRLITNARVSASKAAKDIGVDADRLRKWMERDTDPKDTGDIKAVEAFFGHSLAHLSRVDKFPTKSMIGKDGLLNEHKDDYKDKYIALLEKMASLHDQQENGEIILAYLKTLFLVSARVLAKTEKMELKAAENEMGKLLKQHLLEVRQEGI